MTEIVNSEYSKYGNDIAEELSKLERQFKRFYLIGAFPAYACFVFFLIGIFGLFVPFLYIFWKIAVGTFVLFVIINHFTDKRELKFKRRLKQVQNDYRRKMAKSTI